MVGLLTAELILEWYLVIRNMRKDSVLSKSVWVPYFYEKKLVLKEVPKYPYIDGKHVLEELKYGDFPDQPFVTSSYEPLWTFMDKDGNALYPIWDAVEVVVVSRLEGVRKALHGIKRNIRQEEEEAKEREVKEVEEILFGESGGVHGMKNQSVAFVKPVFLNTDNRG